MRCPRVRVPRRPTCGSRRVAGTGTAEAVRVLWTRPAVGAERRGTPSCRRRRHGDCRDRVACPIWCGSCDRRRRSRKRSCTCTITITGRKRPSTCSLPSKVSRRDILFWASARSASHFRLRSSLEWKGWRWRWEDGIKRIVSVSSVFPLLVP